MVTFGFPYSSTFSPFLRVIWSLFPPNLFAIGLQYLGDATAGEGNKGIKWGQIGECNPASAPCALTMVPFLYFGCIILSMAIEMSLVHVIGMGTLDLKCVNYIKGI